MSVTAMGATDLSVTTLGGAAFLAAAFGVTAFFSAVFLTAASFATAFDAAVFLGTAFFFFLGHRTGLDVTSYGPLKLFARHDITAYRESTFDRP